MWIWCVCVCVGVCVCVHPNANCVILVSTGGMIDTDISQILINEFDVVVVVCTYRMYEYITIVWEFHFIWIKRTLLNVITLAIGVCTMEGNLLIIY